MKRFILCTLVGSLGLAVSGAMVGCSASASVDPPARSASDTNSSSYKKTEVRDANGNLVERKVETKSSN
jgi:hypothetical protein